jgi:hypothetical protein
MMQQLTTIVCRILFVVAFLAAGLGVLEKLVQLFGYTILRGSSFFALLTVGPWQLLEFSAVVLLFVIALQLREIKMSLRARGSD